MAPGRHARAARHRRREDRGDRFHPRGDRRHRRLRGAASQARQQAGLARKPLDHVGERDSIARREAQAVLAVAHDLRQGPGGGGEHGLAAGERLVGRDPNDSGTVDAITTASTGASSAGRVSLA